MADTDKVGVCLWFDTEAEEAAHFYASLLPGSAVTGVHRPPGADSSAPALLCTFTLAGREFTALNGGADVSFTAAASLVVKCADQAEIDRLWHALADGGTPLQGGWIRDRYGLAWQIIPAGLMDLVGSGDPAAAGRVMGALMQMSKIEIAALEAARASE